MIYALIILYMLQANGFVIPTGCFVAAWIITAILFVNKERSFELHCTLNTQNDVSYIGFLVHINT